ncbi:MAG: hypothetical protein NC238_16240 [Dehalobacter sp.]|nr:hypothetical protein [Dehalobacter sp.]
MEQGIWPVIVFRYGMWIYDNIKFKPLRNLLLLSYYIIRVPVEIATGVQIGLGARIGPGICVHHCGDVIIGHRCVIGKYFTINNGVTLISKGPKDKWSFPTIGDRVYVASGAKIMGGVKIGNNVVIGANAVVVKDTPSNVIVGGIPAQVIGSSESWTNVFGPKN